MACEMRAPDLLAPLAIRLQAFSFIHFAGCRLESLFMVGAGLSQVLTDRLR